MSGRKYINRLLDRIAEFSLKCKGDLVKVAPKWGGKSNTTKPYACTDIDFFQI